MPSSPVLLVELGQPIVSVLAERGPYRRWFGPMMADFDVTLSVWEAATQSAPPEGDWAAVILSGSATSVHDELPWAQRAGRWAAAEVRRGTPVLGVCFGHQLLAHHLGGRSGPNPLGPDYSLQQVELLVDDLLFLGLPRTLPCFEVHSDVVLELPPESQLLARSPQTQAEALAFSPRCRGVQFHPEFDVDYLERILEVRGDALELRYPGFVARARQSLQDTPYSRRIIANFLQHIAGLPRRVETP